MKIINNAQWIAARQRSQVNFENSNPKKEKNQKLKKENIEENEKRFISQAIRNRITYHLVHIVYTKRM